MSFLFFFRFHRTHVRPQAYGTKCLEYQHHTQQHIFEDKDHPRSTGKHSSDTVSVFVGNDSNTNLVKYIQNDSKNEDVDEDDMEVRNLLLYSLTNRTSNRLCSEILMMAQLTEWR